MACYDADSFFDSKGVTCAGWASVNCSKPPATCEYADPYEFERVRKACPVTCGDCSVITAGGDPVLKHNGRFVKFSLAPSRLTTLVSWLAKNGDRLSILGATLSHPTRTDNQWFNEIQLMVNATRVLRLSVEQPDVAMKVELDGQDLAFPVKCTWKELVKGRCLDDNTDTQNKLKEFGSAAGHLSFTWSDLKEKKVADRKAKKILALFGPMGMELIFAKASKFESKVAQNAYAHFNVKLMGEVPKHATGVFVNLTTSAHGAWTDLGSVNKHKGYSTSLWKAHGASGLMGKEEPMVCPTNPAKAPPSPPRKHKFGRESEDDDEDEDDEDEDDEDEEDEEEDTEEEMDEFSSAVAKKGPSKNEPPKLAKGVTCKGPLQHMVTEDDPNVGEWGGWCTCPDGVSYQVGDDLTLGPDLAGQLACEGGVPGKLQKMAGPWSRRSVVCAACPDAPATPLAKSALKPLGKDYASAGWKDCDGPSENDYSGTAEVHAPTAGNWGGTCTCPDGAIYDVADTGDGCENLACHGGVAGKCNKYSGPWSGKRVFCAPCPGKMAAPAKALPGLPPTRKLPAETVKITTPTKQTAGHKETPEHEAAGGDGEKPCLTGDTGAKAPAPPAPTNCDGPHENEYTGSKDVHAPDTGNWGGTCTCPDGGVYDVADVPSDSGIGCESLACHGGVSGKCNQYSGPWTGKRVFCAPCPGKNHHLPAPYPPAPPGKHAITVKPTPGPKADHGLHAPPPPKNCDGPTENEVTGSKASPAPNTGAWGGTCTCPDGGVYDVADTGEGEGCESLACHGGYPGNCHKFSGPWSGKRVFCAPCPLKPIIAPPAPPAVVRKHHAPSTSPLAIESAAPPSAVDPATCVGPTENVEYENAPNVGSWGGSCTCPDGQIYEVGDMGEGGEGEGCSSLACYGGTAGVCSKFAGPWAGRKVVCSPCALPVASPAPHHKPGHGDEPTPTPSVMMPAPTPTCDGPNKNQHEHGVEGVGAWGGSCTCPDGQTYQVGDVWSAGTADGECGALACYGGVSGECEHKGSEDAPEPHSFNKITCAPACHSTPPAATPAAVASPVPQPQCTGPNENLVKKLFHQITQGVGGWGGSCTCPDGKVYQVGDLQGHSACSKEDGCPLACDGGKPGKLNKQRGPWSHRSVACVDVSRLNKVTEDAEDAGGWGGDCTCPDGQLYQVGDKDFGGKELACIGGKAGKINEKNGAWSHRKVVCSACPPGTITTAPTPYPMAPKPTPAAIAPTASPAPTPASMPAATAEPKDCDGPTENQLEVDSPYAGDWGGECTCPDGQVYEVADKDFEGKELACFGGESGKVNNYKGPWSKRRVFCAPCPKVAGDELCKAGPKANHYLDKDAPGVGEWGGSCTCPDGQTYQVGDVWSNDTVSGECGALSCHGGLVGKCHKQQGPWSKKSVTCAPCPDGHLPKHPATAAPTTAPTKAPTAAPTAAPTSAPTAAPTMAPTRAPTRAPTIAPTAAPTAAPVAKPSKEEEACSELWPAVNTPMNGSRGDDSFGAWGGSCTCPNGQVYQVGDIGDQCGDLACYGGTSGKCHTSQGAWSGKGVVCADACHLKPKATAAPTSAPTAAPATMGAPINGLLPDVAVCKGPRVNVVTTNAKGTGEWGGSCTCPDGSEYHAGRLMADPTKLACFGGAAGRIHEDHGAWSNVKVDCNVCGDCNGPYQNVVTEHSADAGGWGGDCTCPDGQLYQAGDNNDDGQSLACVGGAAGMLHKKAGAWSGVSVVCSPCPGADAPTAAASNHTAPTAAPTAAHGAPPSTSSTAAPWALTASWGDGEFTKGTGPPSGKAGHAPSAHPDLFSIAVANSTGNTAKLVITSSPKRGWSVLAFKGAHVTAVSVASVNGLGHGVEHHNYTASVLSSLLRRGAAVAEEQIGGTWDDVKQTWTPSQVDLTAGASLTVTVTVREGNTQAVNVYVTGTAPNFVMPPSHAPTTSHAAPPGVHHSSPPPAPCPGGTKNIVTKNANNVGAFGGDCTCPDGEVLQAGDVYLGGADPTLACFGGTPGSYSKRKGPWSYQQVRCGVCESETCLGPFVNVYHEKDPAAGGWGGNCLCPNGRIFAVGDNGVDGKTLDCLGGVWNPKAINQHEGEWSGKSVVCSPCPTSNETIGAVARPPPAINVVHAPPSPSHAAPPGVHNINAWPPAAAPPDMCEKGRENIETVNAPGVGGFGGTCTCPDGSEYEVGDLDDDCATLACFGGTSGKCNRYPDGGSHVKVECNVCKDCEGPFQNIVYNNKAEYLADGGKPGADGNEYNVGGFGGSCTCPDGAVYQVGDRNNDCKSLACVGGAEGQCVKAPGKWSNRSVTCSPCPIADYVAPPPAPAAVGHKELTEKGAVKNVPTWAMTGSWGANEYTKGSGPASGKVEHLATKQPDFFSILGSNNTGSSGELSITSGGTRGWTKLTFKGASVREVSVKQAKNSWEAGGGALAGSFDWATQAWTPKDMQATVGATWTVTAVMEEGNTGTVNVLFTGAEKGSKPLPAPSSPTAAPPAAPSSAPTTKSMTKPKEAGTWTLTGSWGANEYTKGSGPKWGEFEHPSSRKPTLYSIAGNNGYSSSTTDGRSAAELTLTSGETRGWTKISFKGANVKDASVFFPFKALEGTFDWASQTWTPTDMAATVGKSWTLTAVVDGGNVDNVNALFSGAEKGSAPLPAPASPTVAPPSSPLKTSAKGISSLPDAPCDGPTEDQYNQHDLQVGEWGGRCKCPSGHSYLVGLNAVDNDGSLACVGGVPSGNETKPGPWSRKSVICAACPAKEGKARSSAEMLKDEIDDARAKTCDESANVVRDNALLQNNVDGLYAHAGTGGGDCTCPDGQVYQVGSIDGLGYFDGQGFSDQPTLACFGGTAGAHNASASGSATHRAVQCGVCSVPGCAGPFANNYDQHDETTGEYGGKCLCPNGRIFAVGSKDGGKTLNCAGGVWNDKAIKKEKGEWSGKSVVCSPCPAADETWDEKDPVDEDGYEDGGDVAASPPPASAKAHAFKSLNDAGFEFAASPPPASSTYGAIKSLIDPSAAAAADLAKAKQQAVTRAASASAIKGPWISVEGTSVKQLTGKELQSVRDAADREVGKLRTDGMVVGPEGAVIGRRHGDGSVRPPGPLDVLVRSSSVKPDGRLLGPNNHVLGKLLSNGTVLGVGDFGRTVIGKRLDNGTVVGPPTSAWATSSASAAAATTAAAAAAPKPALECNGPPSNVEQENAPGVGAFGGKCTCPDGQIYWVGDKAKGLACEGGVSGETLGVAGNWSHVGVHCACGGGGTASAAGAQGGVQQAQKALLKVERRQLNELHRSLHKELQSDQCTGSALNLVKDDILPTSSGEWATGNFGGTCTCPNGQTYDVGDNNDACGSLACEGGVSGTCNREAGPWSRRRVQCACVTDDVRLRITDAAHGIGNATTTTTALTAASVAASVALPARSFDAPPIEQEQQEQETTQSIVEAATRRAAADVWEASRAAYGEDMHGQPGHHHAGPGMAAAAASLAASSRADATKFAVEAAAARGASAPTPLDLDMAAEAAATRDFEAVQRGEVGVPGLDAARRAVFDRGSDIDSVQSGQQQSSASALEQLNQLEMQNQLYRDFFGKYQRHMVEQQSRASRS